MKFVNRFQELKELGAVLGGPRPALVRVYGRRRLGKTELLRELCERKGGLYLLLEEADPGQQRSSLAQQVARSTRGLATPFPSWDAFWEHLAKLDRKFVVMDEFQRALSIDPLAVSRLQHHWDATFQHRGPSIVLCGSSVGMMQRLTTKKSAPLFGRLAADQRLRPFGYAAVRLLYPALTEEERVRRYCVFGGTPYYHAFSVDRELMDGIKAAFLEPISPLTEEPQNLLRLELKSPTRYNSILYEIGQGTHDLRTLESKVGVPRGGLGPYLETLRHDLDLVQMEDPVCGVRKQARYVFDDPFFSFYFRFVFGNRPLLELGRSGPVLHAIEKGLDAHIGPQFERIAREALVLLNGSTYGDVPIDFTRIGRWWNRIGEEVDIVAEGKGEVLLGEVKWTREPVGQDLLADLQRKAGLIEGLRGRTVRFGLVSRSGFTEGLRKAAQETRTLLLDLPSVARVFDECYGTPR